MPMPAQLTSDFSGPISMAASTAAMTFSVLVTSVWAKRPPISLASAVPLSSWRSATTTRTPRSASSRAVASPSPEAPPVTIADVPFRSISSSTPLSAHLGPGREMCRAEDRACPPQRQLDVRDRHRRPGSHLVRCLHAEQGEPEGQHPGGQVAQRQA